MILYSLLVGLFLSGAVGVIFFNSLALRAEWFLVCLICFMGAFIGMIFRQESPEVSYSRKVDEAAMKTVLATIKQRQAQRAFDVINRPTDAKIDDRRKADDGDRPSASLRSQPFFGEQGFSVRHPGRLDCGLPGSDF